jgi:hypothetical protein
MLERMQMPLLQSICRETRKEEVEEMKGQSSKIQKLGIEEVVIEIGISLPASTHVRGAQQTEHPRRFLAYLTT